MPTLAGRAVRPHPPSLSPRTSCRGLARTRGGAELSTASDHRGAGYHPGSGSRTSGLRTGWKSAVSEKGRVYYYNKATGAKSWKKPAAAGDRRPGWPNQEQQPPPQRPPSATAAALASRLDSISSSSPQTADAGAQRQVASPGGGHLSAGKSAARNARAVRLQAAVEHMAAARGRRKPAVLTTSAEADGDGRDASPRAAYGEQLHAELEQLKAVKAAREQIVRTVSVGPPPSEQGSENGSDVSGVVDGVIRLQTLIAIAHATGPAGDPGASRPQPQLAVAATGYRCHSCRLQLLLFATPDRIADSCRATYNHKDGLPPRRGCCHLLPTRSQPAGRSRWCRRPSSGRWRVRVPPRLDGRRVQPSCLLGYNRCSAGRCRETRRPHSAWRSWWSSVAFQTSR